MRIIRKHQSSGGSGDSYWNTSDLNIANKNSGGVIVNNGLESLAGICATGAAPFPTGIGDYLALYNSSSYGLRLLGYNGSAYRPFTVGPLFSTNQFPLNFNADGSIVLNTPTTETTIADDDAMYFADTSASKVIKKFSWANLCNILAGIFLKDYSVLRYGAVGDGVSNDTNAFAAALTAAKGNCVTVPGEGKIYNVDNITVSGVPVYIRGIENPLIQLTATLASHQILDSTNPGSVEITGCVFDGNRIALGDTIDETIFDFTNPKSVNIHHNKLRNVSREATVCRGTIGDIDVHDNVYENVSAHLWCFQGTADNIKFNNNVSNIGRTHGLEFEQCPATRIQMLDNEMDSITSSCCLLETAKYVMIKGNRFKNAQYGVMLKCSTPNTVDDGVNYQCDEIIIDDNYMEVANLLYSTAVGTGIKQYGTIIVKNNTSKVSSSMVAIADAVKVKLVNNTCLSSSTISQQYRFTNVGTVEVDTLSHRDDVLANTNYLFYFTGVGTVIMNNIICKSLAKLYSFVTTDTTQFFFKNIVANFGDILRSMKVNANVVSAINCVDTSSTIGVTSAPASNTVDVPALGTYFTATAASAKTITSITTNTWMGRRIYIQAKAFALTFTPSATLLTKSAASVVVAVDGYISLEWNGTAWCEV